MEISAAVIVEEEYLTALLLESLFTQMTQEWWKSADNCTRSSKSASCKLQHGHGTGTGPKTPLHALVRRCNLLIASSVCITHVSLEIKNGPKKRSVIQPSNHDTWLPTHLQWTAIEREEPHILMACGRVPPHLSSANMLNPFEECLLSNIIQMTFNNLQW